MMALALTLVLLAVIACAAALDATMSFDVLVYGATPGGVASAVAAAREAGLPERGSASRALLENCALTRKPDQVLGAIHYLRDVEGIEDSPPRIVNELFTDAGIDPPGNLSLYLNRLKERNFLMVPAGKDDKNRFAILTPEGQAHLDKRSNA